MIARRIFFSMLAALSVGASAQPPAGSVLVFHFERTGLPVPVYTFTVHADGSGTYAASYTTSAAASKYSPYPAAPGPAVETTRPITLSAKTTTLLFDRASNSDHLQGCESKLKNIANTGAKTITYTTPAGTEKCTYNYTENKAVASITDTFQGIAETLDEGRSIEQKHRFDRLGLDHELSILADNVRDGRALEVGTIAQVLQSLVDDVQVMDRVRKRANGLLQAGSTAK